MEHCPTHQKANGSIPSQGTYLDCGFNPQSGYIREKTDQRFSLSTFLSLSNQQTYPWVRIKTTGGWEQPRTGLKLGTSDRSGFKVPFFHLLCHLKQVNFDSLGKSSAFSSVKWGQLPLMGVIALSPPIFLTEEKDVRGNTRTASSYCLALGHP